MNLLLQNPSAGGDLAEILIDHYPFVIGRSSSSDRALPMFFISRSHCKFTISGEVVSVEDLQSANGTFVNGKRITTPTPLSPGDQVSFGPLGFKVMLQSVPCTATPSHPVAANQDAMSTVMVKPGSNLPGGKPGKELR